MSVPAPGMDLEAAKAYVATLNEKQLEILKKCYNENLAKKREEDAEAKTKATQQEILESLIRQIPVTVDVLRSSTSPESVTGADGMTESTQTVKEVVLGKMKSAMAGQKSGAKPYRPRGSRERVLVNGHLFVFDKLNYDTKKRFFRCERGSTCPARVHTASDSNRVIQWVQSHNHPAPSPVDIAHYGFDLSRVREGHVMYPSTHIQSVHNSLPLNSLLTPDTEDENTCVPRLNALTVQSSDEAQQKPSPARQPVTIRIPDNFYRSTEAENRKIELALTRFLLQNTDLRNELINKKGDLPLFFPAASKTSLFVFVANVQVNDDIFQMIQVPERKEESIRQVLNTHYNIASTRPLMVSISAKINVPLSQKMIDSWKSEVFFRVDASNANAIKIHPVTKME